jgi:hypothetical protein
LSKLQMKIWDNQWKQRYNTWTSKIHLKHTMWSMIHLGVPQIASVLRKV